MSEATSVTAGNPVRETVEAVARDSYGRLLSYLAARCHDVALAEDALSDAFLAALRTWPERGVPARPEAWLLAAARNRVIDEARHDQVRVEYAEAFILAAREAVAAANGADEFPDERLQMLFLCADPAIDPAIHTPLMLQTVLGIDGARIARAFLISPAAMRQRLVRAKVKIRDAGMAFELPPAAELPRRLEAVTEAIYAAYARGWEDFPGADLGPKRLAEEAIWLARVLARQMPDEPETRGLLALLLYCEARRGARRSPDGRYVPITEQDVRRWSLPLIAEAERELAVAAAAKRPGRFQLEAAIQSVHADRVRTGSTEWPAIALLYEGLVRIAPTLGGLVGRAAAVAEASGPQAGLTLLDEIGSPSAEPFQPYWAVRAHLLSRLNRPGDAREAFDRAITLSEDEAVRRFLSSRRDSL